MDALNEDFLEFIRLLETRKVDYLIVGGYAVAVHGFPRYTGDIDFFVAISPENAERIIHVFEEFGFGDAGILKEDFLKESYVIEIGREPRKIQVLTHIDGVRFRDAYQGRIEIEYGELRLKFIGRKELLQNKRSTGRAKDLIDVQELEKDE